MSFLSNLFKKKSFPLKNQSETIEDYAEKVQAKTGIQVKVKKEDVFEGDVYFSGKDKPVMKLVDIMAGFFVNDVDKKVIAKPSDISGAILDIRNGNVVVAAENLCWLVIKNKS